ncbi:fungal-specific transcription factor domain-containing protein [Apiosordaria backusii]|uniref:Fungal-specific transcription factor domain-containing protein n=1 Tax=Apiosordaria backusii TaxID=314023 RepID=A0AA40EIU2_9PEZI|nr:fungal-specific transcription factor domain-containing protein [Apiosordaria backusii]
MMAQTYDPGAVATLPRMHPPGMSRPQVSIERLPTRRMSNEPRESMNCKSCRKRKIKCNRLRPACEACQVFQCPCVYDAVPKKRGPKTDVLEALLKRVDGLEARLKEKKEDPEASTSENLPTNESDESISPTAASGKKAEDKPEQSAGPSEVAPESEETAIFSSTDLRTSPPSPEVQPDALLDTYFSRFHDKPFHVLDESTLRQRRQLNQAPDYLIHAIFAVAARYTPHPNGYQSAVKLSEEYATRSRLEIDTDEPSVDALQALVLLVTAFTAAGKGKKAYMLLTSAVGMAMALELHREMDVNARVTPTERETRRKLFWSCYLLDRFMACGSKRPSLITDRAIILRLPSWSPMPGSLPADGEFFQSYTNLQYLQGTGKKAQGSSGMLIDICRILGTTNQYLAAGGVKGDSHFPWHSLSNLSKIRQDLDIWASGTEDVFSSLDSLFGRPDSTVLVLSKLVYHLIHCLIYRPFLPIDLSELAGTGQHQSWQIEATNMCFLHANAIAELVEVGKRTASIEWPAFVGFCISTAGTVHIHGAHYSRVGNTGEVNVFSSSAEFLSREMQQLSELRYAWASVQHQRETLQGMYNAHSGLVKSHTTNTMRQSPVFNLEDFFDRYSSPAGAGGQTFSFDAANLNLSDVVVDFTADTYTGQDLYAPRLNTGDPGPSRPNLKRKNTAPSGRKRPDLRNLLSLNSSLKGSTTPGLSTPSSAHRHSFSAASMSSQQSPNMLHTPHSLTSGFQGMHEQNSSHGMMGGWAGADGMGGFPMGGGHPGELPAGLSSMSSGLFSPSFNVSQYRNPTTPGTGGSHQGFDPMFGELPTNTFPTPTPWHGEESGNGKGAMVTSPTGITPSESVGTGTTGDEKDPFLSLLEQLAENESFMGTGNELDFFLAGAPNAG